MMPRPLTHDVARWLRRLLLFFALLFCGAILFVAFFDFTGLIQRSISGDSGREVEMEGKADIRWGWITHAEFKKLRIGNMEGAEHEDMLTAESVRASIDLGELLTGDTVLPEVILDKPVINLEKDKDGNANWHFTDNPEGKVVDAVTPDTRAEIPAIGRLMIREGKLRYKDATRNADIDADITTVIGSADQDERITVAGKGSYKDRPFLMEFTGGSVLTLQETDEPYPLKADITIADTRAQIEGTVMDPLQLKGLDLNLRIKGSDASNIFPILGIAFPPTPPYDVSGELGLEGEVWSFTDFRGKMGDSDLSGDLTWDKSKNRPLLTARFVSRRLDFKDLGPLIGAAPASEIAVTAEQKQELAREQASPYVLPDAPLDISRLKAMDANVTFTGREVISSDLPLDDFYMKVDLEDSLLKLTPLRFGVAGGDISSDMTINARGTPVKIGGDFTFRRLALSQLFSKLTSAVGSVDAKGYIGGRAKLQGTGKSLHDMLGTSNGTIGIGMEGGQLSNLLVELLGLDIAESLGFLLAGDQPVTIRCVIGDFGVTDGLMQANTLVIDTSDTNVTGKGTLNLKNEELNLRLKPKPKDGSLLSLRSPIRVTGTLKNPNIGIEPAGLIAKGGVGAALGAVLLPLGVIAFVEPGLGKDSDCAQLVREMNARSGAKVPQNK